MFETVQTGQSTDGTGGTPPAPTVDGGQLLVLLPVYEHRLVLAADRVREVVTIGNITILPTASDALQGAIAVRGALLPLYDVRGWCEVHHLEDDGVRTKRFGTIVELDDGSYVIQTTDHPTIVTSATPVHHRQPLVIDDKVCIGVDPHALLADLTRSVSAAADPLGTDPHAHDSANAKDAADQGATV